MLDSAQPQIRTGVLRGADLLARTLEHLGVTRIFSLSGNHIMPLYDALIDTQIEIVHVRHEAAAVHMADAWGRLTGEVGVALVTGGQGHTNGAAALFTALAAESPVLLLSGHAGLNELGLGAFQEMAQADIARPTAKASWTAKTAEGLGEDLALAMRIARTGRPGPVHLSLPVDLLEQKIDASKAKTPSLEDAGPHAFTAEPSLVEATALRIAEAERPLVICGPMMCGKAGREAMAALEQASGAPVIAMQSPRGVNDPGLGALAETLARADLLVLIGKQLDFTLKFGGAPISPDCGFVVVDPDAELIARAARLKGERLLLSGVADPFAFLKALAGKTSASKSAEDWRAEVQKALTYEPPAWREARGSAGRLHPVELCREVSAFLERHPGGTLICDGGEIGQWPQALVRAERRLINGVSGTIGASIPFAIAAQGLEPEKPVVAILGDGTFGFHMAEFDTAVRYGLPIIVVVGNDARWNAEYQIQLRSFGPERAKHCELLPSRYDLVAEALGGFGALATSPEELRAALEAARASGKPSCVNVMIEGAPAPAIRRA